MVLAEMVLLLDVEDDGTETLFLIEWFKDMLEPLPQKLQDPRLPWIPRVSALEHPGHVPQKAMMEMIPVKETMVKKNQIRRTRRLMEKTDILPTRRRSSWRNLPCPVGSLRLGGPLLPGGVLLPGVPLYPGGSGGAEESV